MVAACGSSDQDGCFRGGYSEQRGEDRKGLYGGISEERERLQKEEGIERGDVRIEDEVRSRWG
jgi:hypothetical protein